MIWIVLVRAVRVREYLGKNNLMLLFGGVRIQFSLGGERSGGGLVYHDG